MLRSQYKFIYEHTNLFIHGPAIMYTKEKIDKRTSSFTHKLYS